MFSSNVDLKNKWSGCSIKSRKGDWRLQLLAIQNLRFGQGTFNSHGTRKNGLARLKLSLREFSID